MTLDSDLRELALMETAWAIEEDFDVEADNSDMIEKHIRELLEELGK